MEPEPSASLEVRRLQSFGIILLCILAATLYDVAQDQITARVCVEYFHRWPSADLRHQRPDVAGHRLGHPRTSIEHVLSPQPSLEAFYAPLAITRFESPVALPWPGLLQFGELCQHCTRSR